MMTTAMAGITTVIMAVITTMTGVGMIATMTGATGVAIIVTTMTTSNQRKKGRSARERPLALKMSVRPDAGSRRH